MTIRIGDKVRFLNDVGGGRVSAFKNKEIVLVEDEDGFEIPVLITECVVVEQADGPALTASASTTASLSPKKEESPLIFQDKKNKFEAWLAISPEFDDVPLQGKMELFLINDSNYFCYYLCEENNTEGKALADGLLYPNTHQAIGSYTAPQLGEMGKIRVRLLPFRREGNYRSLESIEKTLSFNAVKLSKSKSYEETPLLSFKALLLPLHQDPMESALKDLHEEEDKGKHHKAASRLKSPKKKQELVEVDLHIEALLDDFSSMTKGEILEHQLSVFEDTLKAYKGHKGQRLIFIHGVGNGRLKTDIRRRLQNQHFDFQDASFREYGYGATMVIIR